MSHQIRFLRADWPRALGLAAITWLCCIAIDIGNASFVGWLSKLQSWAFNAPLLFAVFVLLRVILFFLAYSMLYARRMSFDEAYKRFAVGRL